MSAPQRYTVGPKVYGSWPVAQEGGFRVASVSAERLEAATALVEQANSAIELEAEVKRLEGIIADIGADFRAEVNRLNEFVKSTFDGALAIALEAEVNRLKDVNAGLEAQMEEARKGVSKLIADLEAKALADAGGAR